MANINEKQAMDSLRNSVNTLADKLITVKASVKNRVGYRGMYTVADTNEHAAQTELAKITNTVIGNYAVLKHELSGVIKTAAADWRTVGKAYQMNTDLAVKIQKDIGVVADISQVDLVLADGSTITFDLSTPNQPSYTSGDWQFIAVYGFSVNYTGSGTLPVLSGVSITDTKNRAEYLEASAIDDGSGGVKWVLDGDWKSDHPLTSGGQGLTQAQTDQIDSNINGFRFPTSTTKTALLTEVKQLGKIPQNGTLLIGANGIYTLDTTKTQLANLVETDLREISEKTDDKPYTDLQTKIAGI